MTKNSNQRRFTWPVAIVLICAIAAGSGGFFLWWTGHTASAGYDRLTTTGRQIASALSDIAQVHPQVSIRNRVVTQQSAATLELAVVERSISVEREMVHRYLGSTKELRLRAQFMVKAGFNLEEPFTVNVESGRVEVILPEAQILSIEQSDVEVEEMLNGYWNKIQPEEIEKELAALPAIAREKAGALGLEDEAVAVLSKKLRDRIGDEVDLSIETRATAPKD